MAGRQHFHANYRGNWHNHSLTRILVKRTKHLESSITHDNKLPFYAILIWIDSFFDKNQVLKTNILPENEIVAIWFLKCNE